MEEREKYNKAEFEIRCTKNKISCLLAHSSKNINSSSPSPETEFYLAKDGLYLGKIVKVNDTNIMENNLIFLYDNTLAGSSRNDNIKVMCNKRLSQTNFKDILEFIVTVNRFCSKKESS